MERSKFLVDILAELDGEVAEFPMESRPIQPREKAVGELSPYEIKMCHLLVYYSRELDRLKVEGKYTTSAPERGELEFQCQVIDAKCRWLKETLYTSLRENLRLFLTPNVGIRNGYTVVEAVPKDALSGLLGELFGRGE